MQRLLEKGAAVVRRHANAHRWIAHGDSLRYRVLHSLTHVNGGARLIITSIYSLRMRADMERNNGQHALEACCMRSP